MSMFMQQYIPLHVGTPGWQFAPVPSWGVNPLNAGPRRVGVGGGCAGCGGASGCGAGCTGCAGCGGIGVTAEEQYNKVTWGHVAGAAAGALVVGLLIGYYSGKESEKTRSSYVRRGHRSNRSSVWAA